MEEIVKKLAMVLAVALTTQGCASMATRGGFMSDRVEHDPRDDFPIPIYLGTVTDIGMAGVALSSPVSWAWSDTPWWMIVTTPLFLVDLPLSFVADTFCLPSDISHWCNSKRQMSHGDGDLQRGGHSPPAARLSDPTP
jgi:uncharacterized protein YceK